MNVESSSKHGAAKESSVESFFPVVSVPKLVKWQVKSFNSKSLSVKVLDLRDSILAKNINSKLTSYLSTIHVQSLISYRNHNLPRAEAPVLK